MAGRDTRDILWRFLGDSKSLEKASKRGQKSVGGMEKSFGKLTKAVGAVGVAFGAREVLQFAGDAAKMAKQSEIAAVSADKALGPAARRLREEFGDLRKQVGFNRLEFDQYMATQGLMITSLGAGQDAAAEYAGEMLQLGGDLAAFKGEADKASEAIDAIGGAIRGEFDPLEKWGVKLSEAKVKAEIARRRGIDPLFASLSEGEQRLEAIIGLIEKGAAPALGALGDAAEIGATKATELQTELEDLKIELGKELEPAITDVTQAALDAAPALVGIGKAGASAVGNIGNLTGAVTAFGDESKSGLAQFGDFMAGTIRWVNTGVPVLNTLAGEWAGYMDEIGEATYDADRAAGALTLRMDGLAASITGVGTAASGIGGRYRLPQFEGSRKYVNTETVSGHGTTAPSTSPTSRRTGNHTIRHGGGVVPGRRGQNVSATLKAGEKVIPAGGGGGAGGPSIIVQAGLIAAPQDVARAIVDALQEYNRNQGAVPIEVRNAQGIV